jgi:hypothetical protein
MHGSRANFDRVANTKLTEIVQQTGSLLPVSRALGTNVKTCVPGPSNCRTRITTDLARVREWSEWQLQRRHIER